MSCFLRPSQPDTLAAMLSRIDRLEKDLSRSLVIEPGIGVHIPGQLTVGGGASGGGGDRLTTGAPDVVTGLALAAGGDSTSVWLDVSWTYPENSAARVVAFEIRFKRTTEDTEYGYAVTQNSAAFRLNGLVSDTGYTVAIRSLSQLGSASAWSADVALNSGADTTAPAQVGVVVVATGNKTQMGSWPSNTEVDLDHYLINVATSSAVNGAGKFTTGLVVDGKITSATVVTIDGLDGTGDQYFWQVAAVDATGNQGPYSATVNNTTTLIESAWISSLVASKITAGTIGTEILKLTNSPNSRIESFDGTSLVLKGNGELIATSATITGAITATSGTFGDAEGGFTIGTDQITFTDAGVAKGKLDINTSYVGGVYITTRTAAGLGTSDAQILLRDTSTWLTSGSGGDTAIGSLGDGASGVTGNLRLDAITKIIVDCAAISFREGSGTEILSFAKAAGATNVGQIKLWTGDTNAMGQIIWEAAGGAYTGDIQMDRYQNEFRIVRGGSVDMLIDSGGSIYNRGGSYGTISDPRIKKDIRPADTRRAQIRALDVVDYELVDRTGTHRGLDAAAAQLVYPELVETLFADPKHPEGLLSVKTSQLTWDLLLLVQELETRVEILEA